MTKQRTTRATAVVILAASLLLAVAAPVSAGPPAPAVPVAPAPAGGAGQVFGANAAGDTFYNSASSIGGSGLVPGEGRIRRADGTVVALPEAFQGRGVVGSDGRLWMPSGGAVRATAPDGTQSEYPVAVPEAGAVVEHVDVGPDGRIWFLDRSRNGVGSMALDGTGVTFWTVAGSGGLWRFAPGVDGRMWMARTGGGLQAITPAGAITSYGTLGAGVRGLRATAGALYAMVKGNLVRIAPDGTRTTVYSTNDALFVDVGTSDGWAWFLGNDDVIAVSPSGRVARFSMPVSYAYPNLLGDPSLAPAVGGGFVGVVGGSLSRLPSAMNETFTASGTVISKGGAFVLRVTATGRTPGGSPLSGPVEVVLWGSQLLGDSIGYFSEVRQTSVGRIDLVGGRGTLEVPITASLVRRARPGGLLHTGCCGVTVRRPPTATGPGLSSPGGGISNSLVNSYYGPVVASPTMLWLDQMSNRATGAPMDTAGQVYWAGRMTSGSASRLSVTQGVVGSGAYRRHRATVAYQRWFERAPSTSERDYWAKRLETGTTSAMDLALAAKPAARDAGGTSNAQRAAHLAEALGLPTSYAAGFKSKLDAGTPWIDVVKAAYTSSGAKEARINAMGPRSSYTPSLATLGSELVRTGDERGPLTKVLATLPNQTDGY